MNFCAVPDSVDLQTSTGVPETTRIFCFGEHEMINTRRNGEEKRIEMRDAKYGDEIQSVNEKMEHFWDEIVYLSHFEKC